MPILTTGGAEGADTIFAENAIKCDHEVFTLSFDGHKTKWNNKWDLTDEQLSVANPFIERAAVSLNRQTPKNKYTLKLIQRNYYQVRKAEIVIAVAPLEDQSRVSGGTGWAVEMAKELKMPIYLYACDECSPAWYQFDYDIGQFVTTKKLPPLTERYAGIGCRKINEAGIKAIQYLYFTWSRD